jgi:hypothetical protein
MIIICICVGSITTSVQFYDRRIATAVHSVHCNGSERTLLDCQYNNGSSAQCEGIVAYVLCRGKIVIMLAIDLCLTLVFSILYA